MEGFESTVQSACQVFGVWKNCSLNNSKRLIVSSYLASRIRRVAYIPDGSFSLRRNREAAMDLQQIRRIMLIGLSGVQFSL